MTINTTVLFVYAVFAISIVILDSSKFYSEIVDTSQLPFVVYKIFHSYELGVESEVRDISVYMYY